MSTPIYLEYGGGFLYTRFNNVMDAGYDVKFFSLYFPVNVSYRFVESDVSGSFFTGPYLKYNMSGSAAGMDMLELGGAYKVQVGWQAGVDVCYADWYLSFSYFGDFSNLLEMSRTGYDVSNKVSGILIGFGFLF